MTFRSFERFTSNAAAQPRLYRRKMTPEKPPDDEMFIFV
jgi:hypothetical protein